MVTCPICNNLSVKALVLRYEYYEIFTDEERGICRKYLKNLGSIINYRKRIKNDYKLQKGKTSSMVYSFHIRIILFLILLKNTLLLTTIQKHQTTPDRR